MSAGPNNVVATFSGYKVNGVELYTKQQDNIRSVQNNGVSLVADVMLVSSAEDKNPRHDDMNFFGVIQYIWEVDYYKFRVLFFKCDWVENVRGIKVEELGFTLTNKDAPNKARVVQPRRSLRSTKATDVAQSSKDGANNVVVVQPRRSPRSTKATDVAQSSKDAPNNVSVGPAKATKSKKAVASKKLSFGSMSNFGSKKRKAGKSKARTMEVVDSEDEDEELHDDEDEEESD
ncbi:hypothetical protein ACLB2K_020172 [Fragaria x ananassa]